ncbi:MAG: imidazolonepropionase, partial [Bacillota bacterium]|nr:imidazolonepropionase [Bacillota bacterium]
MKRSLLIHAAELVTPKGGGALKGPEMENVARIKDGAVYSEDGIIKAVGETGEVLKYLDGGEYKDPVDIMNAAGKCVIPGFVDSHTHFVFGGYRPDEFMGRLRGDEYIKSLKKGGGILETVRATEKESEEQLFAEGLSRLRAMLSQGVTTVEGKSGYGLDEATELKQLEVLKRLGQSQKVEVLGTYLGAHAIPEAYKGKADAYVDFMIEKMLPDIKNKNLAEFCDVFCEDHVFSVAQSERLLKAAKALGFKLKIHADEIVSLGGAELAARTGALSADHLLMVSQEGVSELSKSQTVATLLP